MLKEVKTSNRHYFIDEQNICQGEYKRWWDNGHMFEHYFHINGKIHGEVKKWWPNGQLKLHCIYVNGKKHGEYKWWHQDGPLITHCFMVDNSAISFKEIPYPKSKEDRMYINLKYDLQILTAENVC